MICPSLSWTWGPASTLDAVDSSGQHLGGLIIPGPGTMLDSLGAKTGISIESEIAGARLKREAGEPQKATREAIESGIASAQIGALNSFLEKVKSSLSKEEAAKLKIVATGGGSTSILLPTEHQLIHDPLLVFKGMLLCWQDEQRSH